MKKTILFIADKPDWAYEFMIKAWLPFLQKDYDCFVAYDDDYNVKKNNSRSKIFQFIFNIKSLLKFFVFKIINKNEAVYFLDKSGKYYYPKYPKEKVFKYKTDLSKELTDKKNFDIKVEMAFYFQFMSVFPFTSEKKFVGIYTDSFPHEGPSFDEKTKTDLKKLSRKEFFEKYLKPYDGIIVGSSGLYNDYKELTDKITFGNGIYLQDEFVENKNIGEKEGLTIGWTGNPNRPMKGFKEVIEPAIEEVNKTGRKVSLKTKFSGPYQDLLTFYSDVDVIAIASEADTGPSLFAEASLSKVPAISTKIGFPKMIIEDGINGIIVNRDIEEMKNLIGNTKKSLMGAV